MNDQITSERIIKKERYNLNYPNLDELNTYNVNLSIKHLRLPARLENILKKEGINTIGELYSCSDDKLRNIKEPGSKYLQFLINLRNKIQVTEDVQNKESKSPVENSNNPDPIIPEDVMVFHINDSIKLLGLPTRVENVLDRQGNIDTIGKFYYYPQEKFIKFRNLGKKYANYIIKLKQKIRIVKSVESMLKSIQTEYQHQEILNELLIENLIKQSGNPRAVEFIQRRYGLVSGEKETLEEIGEENGITRERVRQIHAHAIKKMRYISNLTKIPIVELINSIIRKKGGIISDEEADRLVPPAFNNPPYDGSSILDLIFDLGWIQKHKIGDVSFYSPQMHSINLSEFIEEIVTILSNSEALVEKEFIINKLSVVNNNHELISSLVYRCCILDPRIDQPVPGKFTTFLHSGKSIYVSLMNDILEKEQMPLHFTEIADKVNDLLNNSERKLDVRRAHALLIEDKLFAHSGINGTYGLASWGFRKELTPQIIVECLRKAGFPLHWKQIYNYVSKYKNTKPQNITTCLETNKLFKKVDVGTFWLNEE